MTRWSFGFVRWCLRNYGVLAIGIWPDSQRGEDSGLCQKYRPNYATFEARCFLAALIAVRVKSCGLDGFLVEEVYGMRHSPAKPMSRVAHERHLTEEYIRHRVTWVINYVADSTTESYGAWRERTRDQRRNNFGARSVKVAHA